MSGHSHFATIRRQKEANDSAKGKVFSKMAKAIAVAVREGGGPDPDSNYKLRVAIETARGENVPKDNIKRAIENASSVGNMEEIQYEGFGPGGVNVVVQTMTDNRNRTVQELKNIFDRAGGTLGGPNSVAFNFEKKGFILVNKSGNADEQMLKLIDLGAEDVNETGDGIEVYVSADKLFEVRKALEEAGFVVTQTELIEKPKNLQSISNPNDARKFLSFIDTLDDNDDVQKVFTNADIPDNLAL